MTNEETRILALGGTAMILDSVVNMVFDKNPDTFSPKTYN